MNSEDGSNHDHRALSDTRHPNGEDWSDSLPINDGTKFFKSIDWFLSTLGPLEEWPATLRFAVRLMLSDSRGACIYWGDEWVAIYNEVYTPMAGQAHPNLMGKPFKIGYPELWAGIAPIFEQVFSTRATTNVENIELFTTRHGYNEETYFIGQFIPIPGEDGAVLGVYNTVYESTFTVLQTRRRNVTNAIAAIPECGMRDANSSIENALRANGRDLPMVMLYSLEESKLVDELTLKLRLNIGITDTDSWVPLSADITSSDIGIVPHMRSAYERKAIVEIRTDDPLFGHLTPLLDNVNWSGFGERPETLVIAPLISAGNTFGFLVAGTNPRRAFTDQCREFFSDVNTQIAAKWASAYTAEQSKAREQRLIQSLEERERRIRYMAESAPVGMLQLTLDGSIAWANQHYRDIIGDPEQASDATSFITCFVSEDQGSVEQLWKTLKAGKSASCEARLNRHYQPPTQQEWPATSPDAFYTWIWVQGFPLVDEGATKLVMICVTDISGPKWAESVQHRVAAAAEKAKRQQEEFIDITSHEMRNPLSAMMQSAQSITAALRHLQPHLDRQELLLNLQEAMEAAETVLSCGVYQKRIIDDVLMLSRLENEMLSITPAVVDPIRLVRNTLKMLEGDARSAQIETSIIRHQSLAAHNIENVFCDPSRLAQILTNLISNAFKFTRSESTRLTEITCGVSLQPPKEDSVMTNLQWFFTGRTHSDLTSLPGWGRGDTLYLFFVIRDTGCGLTQNELRNLFNRFTQASTKTHIVHGGSGLGLYISRELAEKHGGQIGVKSEPGKGSTFAFYVKGRRAPAITPPPLDVPSVNGESSEVRKLVDEFKMSLHDNRQFRVLLVEDNLVNQRVLRRQLEKAGCLVTTANDGLEGFDAFWKSVSESRDQEKSKFDVLLMDWNMPHLDGVSCTRRIRSHELENKISEPAIIIGITANARNEQLSEAREAGTDVVLSKPFLLAELMAQIRLLVKR